MSEKQEQFAEALRKLCAEFGIMSIYGQGDHAIAVLADGSEFLMDDFNCGWTPEKLQPLVEKLESFMPAPLGKVLKVEPNGTAKIELDMTNPDAQELVTSFFAGCSDEYLRELQAKRNAAS